MPLPTSRLPSPLPLPPSTSHCSSLWHQPHKRKGQVLLPRKEGGAEQLPQEGKEKGGKEGSGQQKKWNPVGGLCIVLTSFIFSKAKPSPRPSQSQGYASISENPCWGRLPLPRGDSPRFLVDLFQRGGLHSVYATDCKHLHF